MRNIPTLTQIESVISPNAGRYVMLGIICLGMAFIAHADEPQTSGLEEYLKNVNSVEARRVSEIVVSPSGRFAAAVLHTSENYYMDYMVGIRSRMLVLVDIDRRQMIPLTDPSEDSHRPAWCPEGFRLAFFSRREGVPGLEVIDVRSRARQRLARISWAARNPIGTDAQIMWSNDGHSIAYVVQPGVPWEEQLLKRFSVAPAALTEPIVIKQMKPVPAHYQSQGMTGGFDNPVKEVWIVGARNGKRRKVLSSRPASMELLNVDTNEKPEVFLVRDGEEVSTISISDEDQETRRTSVVFRILGKFKTFRKVSHDKFFFLVESDDGVWTLWALTARGDRTYHSAVVAKGLKHKELAPLLVSSDGKFVLGSRHKGTSEHLVSYLLGQGTEQVIFGEGSVTHGVVGELLSGGAILAVVATSTEPETLFVANLEDGSRRSVGRWPGVASTLATGRVRIVSWKSDGVAIEGLLVLPDDGGKGAPYPTLLYLHGGPEHCNFQDLDSLLGGRATSAAHVFARSGYAVFLPNFRGSTGYGPDFGRDLSNGRLYKTPAKDTLAGLSEMVAKGIADPDRLGIYGSSFGGMLTAWIIGRDHRFKGAVSVNGGLDMLAWDRLAGD